MTKIYNIEEYGTNFATELYDPKALMQDTSSFYENLGKERPFSELKGFSSQKTAGNLFRRKPQYEAEPKHDE